MQSLSLKIDGDVDPAKVMPWIERIAQSEGPNLLRWKGILSLKDEPRRFVLQGVHMIIEGDLQREWKPGEKRESRLVFIGHDINREALEKGFQACAA